MNSKGVEKLLETIKRSSENLQSLSAKSDAALERNEKLATETALGRPKRKSALEDFVDDLVHRPPNAEQIRQLKEPNANNPVFLVALMSSISR